MTRAMLLFPTRCLGRSCGRVFIGPGHLCETCARLLDVQSRRATRAEIVAARRQSVRRRLGMESA